jgi:hypothetical protein
MLGRKGSQLNPQLTRLEIMSLVRHTRLTIQGVNAMRANFPCYMFSCLSVMLVFNISFLPSPAQVFNQQNSDSIFSFHLQQH